LSPDGEVTVARLLGTCLGDPTGEWLGDDLDAQRQRAELVALPHAVSGSLLLDLGNVRWMARDGTMLLIQLFRSLRAAGKAMALCGLSAPMTEVFEIIRLDRLIPCFPNRETALTWLTEGPKEA
jgi:anti-anti-sigma factor